VGLSSPGIGTSLDVNSIVTQLMSVESQPLTALNTKEASYQAKLSAYGTLSSALSSLQSSLSNLIYPSKFRSYGAAVADATIASATSTSSALPGAYSLNVTQLAASQTLVAKGVGSTTAAVGSGIPTTIKFDFGTIGYAPKGAALGQNVVSEGIAAGSLIINGSTIATSAATTSARALATQINLAKSTTGVSATAVATESGTLAFSAVATGVGDSYALEVGGVTVASLSGPASLSAADLDTALTGNPNAAALAAAGISVSGSAAAGTLAFKAADGSNLQIKQTLSNVSGDATGGLAGLVSGETRSWTGSVTLTSSKAITIAGSNPTAAGFAAGESKLVDGSYVNGSFALDASRTAGEITIDPSNNTLQGIRDAINAAGMGVSASIISDGSDQPYRLVLTSTKTGAASSMRIAVDGDSALQDLLAYDASGTQNMTQTSEAQNTLLSVNGINITSASATVTDAIQGTTLNVSKLGSTTLTVSRDTKLAQRQSERLCHCLQHPAKTVSSLGAYDAKTEVAGTLNGEAVLRTVQTQVRTILGNPLKDTGGSLESLTQVGISIDKTGVMSLDNGKLQKAINDSYGDIASLFATQGRPTDSLIAYSNAGAKAKPGTYAVSVTRLATQGTLAGNQNLGSGQTTIAADTTLSVTLDGTEAKVKLPAGSYSATELAAMLQTAINGTTKFSNLGSALTVSLEGGQLKLQSNRFGSASNISIASATGTPASSLIGNPSATLGLDVQGTIGGVPASGSGRNLTGAVGSPAEGLRLEVVGGALGARGSVAFTNGYAAQLDKAITDIIGTTGSLTAATTGINASIADIGKRRDALNLRLADIQQRYLDQFNALDVAISKMNSTSSYLTQQLELIANQTAVRQ
jgi:flagellar hook-associated protein 2